MCSENEQANKNLQIHISEKYKASIKGTNNLMRIQKLPINSPHKISFYDSSKPDQALLNSYLTFTKEGIVVSKEKVKSLNTDIKG
jgi:hypothetical protein